MRKFIGFILLVLLIASLVVPFTPTPVEAWDYGDKIVVDNGVEAIYLGKTITGRNIFRTTISGPKYLDDLQTLIKSNWAYDLNASQWYAEDNLFTATVKGTKVTVWYENTKLSWEPDVYLGTKKFGSPTSYDLLGEDPINENYYGNTLQWSYGDITRNLRIIEGMLIEYYLIPSLPTDDIQVIPHTVKDAGFIWTRPAEAWDAEGEHLDLITGKNGELTLTLEAMKNATFPITIDPDTTFTPSASCAYLREASTEWWPDSWDEIHDDASADDKYSYKLLVEVNVMESAASLLSRAFVYFDTSGLPDDCTVDSAILKLYGIGSPETEMGAWTLQVQTGSGTPPTYPHDPLVVGDYLYSYYSGSGGTLASGSMGTGYKNITLNATGEGWVSKVGTTKFALRELQHDISNSDPGDVTKENSWEFYPYGQGDGYWPELVVTYSASAAPTVTTNAASDISKTTAKLHAYLSADGGAPCEIRWEYDTDSGTPYAYNTTWSGNYTTGQSADEVIADLDAETLYYFRAQAQNDEGIGNGTEINFTTLSSLNPPSAFLTIPRSDSEISLKWTKGEGSSRTYIRYKIGEYPTSLTDGNLACNTTVGSYLLEGLTRGTTYYFKAWGWDGGNFSASNITEMATTLAAVTEGESPITTPTPPPGFFSAPSIEGLSNLPFYDHFNSVADTIEIPRTSFWLIWALGFAVVLGAVTFVATGSPLLALAAIGVGIGGAWSAGVCPGWVLMIFVLLGGSISYVYMHEGGG